VSSPRTDCVTISFFVIASDRRERGNPGFPRKYGLPRRFAPRNDELRHSLAGGDDTRNNKLFSLSKLGIGKLKFLKNNTQLFLTNHET
jgi:hypothetical protein